MSIVLGRTASALGLVVALSGCGTAGELSDGASLTIPATSEQSHVAATDSVDATGSLPPSGDLPVLPEGPITPGTYVIMPPPGGWVECDLPDCPSEPPHARSLQVEMTVPPGWEGIGGTAILLAPPRSSEGPDGAAVAIGWNPVGLHSDPCHPVRGHYTPDILLGPGVDDFVNAVIAHPTLDVSEPVDTEVGGYSGQFITLWVPPDISDCGDWRPFEPGIYAQGPDNIWNLWVIDVEGVRMLILTAEFPRTSAEDSAELRAMVESIRFVP